MRRAVVLTVVSLLAACGGGDGNNNGNGALRDFNYGTPAAPNAAQQSTATTAQTQLHGVVTATSTRQAINASSAPTLTDSLAATLPALVVAPSPEELQAHPWAEGEPMAAVRRSSALSGNCITVNGTSVSYNNCSLNSPGYTLTLNGSLTASSNSVTWNLTETYAYSASGYTLNGNSTWTGNLTATSSTVVGQGRSAYHITGNYQGTNVSYDYTAAMDLNLTFQASPFCITGGTLEIRRVVTYSNGTATPVHDSALRFTWTGCGTYTVARGT